ncbi:hypothetical protein C8R46DRAFT_1038809 [Mycena filopes]|nr:hypothetical protein C8R46DRAFT_1038809 [Mycena filopes]
MASNGNTARKKTTLVGLGRPTVSEPSGARARLRSHSQNAGGSQSRGGSSANPSRPPSSSASTPTAASLARQVDATAPAAPPFGSSTPRIPPVIFSRILQGTPRAAPPDNYQSSAFMANTGVDGEAQDASGAGGSATARESSSRSEASSPLPPLSSREPSIHGSRGGSSRHSEERHSEARSQASRSVSRSSHSSHSMGSLDSKGNRRSREGLPREPLLGQSPRHSQPPHLSGESVTAALGARSSPRFFKKAGHAIELYDETLSASVERYHYVYDAQNEDMDDPLLYYGAVDGFLPGKSAAQSKLLRDVVIRYDERHYNFEWEDILSLIASIYSLESSSVKVSSIADPISGRESYCLDLMQLSLVGHAVIAVQQILDGINAFSTSSTRRRFEVDTGFTYLRMLEDRASKTELRFALSVLQLRLDRADTHIRANLSGIRETLTGQAFTETLDSVVSTVSEVREKYGSGTPSQQLYRMLARHDYGRRAQIINRTAYHQLVESIQKAEWRKLYLKKLQRAQPRQRTRATSVLYPREFVSPTLLPETINNAQQPLAPFLASAIFAIPGAFPLKAQYLGGHR